MDHVLFASEGVALLLELGRFILESLDLFFELI